MKMRATQNPTSMINNRGGSDACERRWLFHGTTPELIPKIIKQGFNRSLAIRSQLGRGTYFATNASTSHGYSTADANGERFMFLCRVLIGDYCKGNSGQLLPDSKFDNSEELFDSTVNDIQNPSVFVTYHDAQVYPEYLVAYTVLKC